MWQGSAEAGSPTHIEWHRDTHHSLSHLHLFRALIYPKDVCFWIGLGLGWSGWDLDQGPPWSDAMMPLTTFLPSIINFHSSMYCLTFFIPMMSWGQHQRKRHYFNNFGKQHAFFILCRQDNDLVQKIIILWILDHLLEIHLYLLRLQMFIKTVKWAELS